MVKKLLIAHVTRVQIRADNGICLDQPNLSPMVCDSTAVERSNAVERPNSTAVESHTMFTPFDRGRIIRRVNLKIVKISYKAKSKTTCRVARVQEMAMDENLKKNLFYRL